MRANNETSRAYGITLFRLIVGLVFVMHGAQKLFTYGHAGVVGGFTQMGIPAADLTAWVVTIVEFFGGLALILGLGTRIVAVPLVIDMLGAIVFVHWKNGFFLPNGYEFALTLLVASASLALTGSGALALDNLIGRSRRADVAEPVPVAEAKRRVA
jgi:putative oxidoreductase